MIISNFDKIFDKNDIVIYTQGVFDLLHNGHINYLINSKKYGNKLIVGVDSDEKVQLRKGLDRPFQNWETRVQNLLNLNLIDYIFKKNINIDSSYYIDMIKPSKIIISTDHNPNVTRLKFLEKEKIELIVIKRTENISTTQILKAKRFKQEQKTSHLRGLSYELLLLRPL